MRPVECGLWNLIGRGDAPNPCCVGSDALRHAQRQFAPAIEASLDRGGANVG